MTKRLIVAAVVAWCGFALAAARPAVTKIPLNGLWDFRFENRKSLEEVSEAGFAANEKMPVPGCWNAMPAHVNQRGTGLYRRTFVLDEAVPAAALVVDGFGLRSRYRLDGRELGVSVLPWSCISIETGPLAAGEHVLEAAVDSLADKEKVKLFEDAYDFYAYGGFFHGIALETRPVADGICRLAVRTRDYRSGTIEIEAFFAGKGPSGDFTAEVLFDGGRNAAARPVRFANRRAELTVPAFRTWSPSAPNLHTVRVTAGGVFADARFGIRQVGTADGRITLNGEPVYLKGVNRHESHYEFGASVPTLVMWEDLQNLRAMGGNYVRGSHYPQTAEFLDMCDELGILVWEESMGWGNRPVQMKDPVFCDLQEEQTRLMARNSINHPSIIISGFLNEPQSWSPECLKLVNRLVAALRSEDTGHLVTFACACTANDIAHVNTDVITYNTYPCWYGDPLQIGTDEEMRANIRACHARIVKYFRDKYQDRRPILIGETGVKADYGFRDPQGRSQYSEEFQADYTRMTLEEVFANPEIAGISIWHLADCKTYTRVANMRDRAGGVNTGGLFDRYRRPKLVADEVRKLFTAKKD